MTYEAIRSLAGLTGLFIFIALFAAALVYVLWPGNKERFERARHLPLEKDEGEPHRSEPNGR
jgi:cytochrome c oxidase cbb3-type subunit 4